MSREWRECTACRSSRFSRSSAFSRSALSLVTLGLAPLSISARFTHSASVCPVLPTFEAHEARIAVVLSDNGREFCGRPDRHPYELFLQLEDIQPRTTRVKRPQSNGIVERFHRTLLDEHFRVEGRRTRFETIDEMQKVLDDYLVTYNTKRPHQGRGMNGRTPITVFTAGLPKPTQQNKETSPPQKPENQIAA
jgi:transposase InsO family protein